MKPISQFTLRGMLAITFVACVAFASLAKPSIWWFLIGATATASIVVRMVVFSRKWRPFGGCFVASMLAYYWGLSLMTRFRNFGSVVDYWEAEIAMPAWGQTPGQGLPDAFDAFGISLLLWTAVALSAAAAFVVQLLFRSNDDA